MYRISKSFQFHAAHSLPHLPAEHKCSRVHGHTYMLTVELAAEELTVEEGWIRDYGDLSAVQELIDQIDHRNLNDIFYTTTAECIAHDVYYQLNRLIPELVAVRISESPTSWAEYRP